MSTVVHVDSSVNQTKHQDTVNPSVIRLAIVGCGPRGLQCLESLSRQLSEQELSKLAITVFEPASYPGAGCIYDPKQPHLLRMNFATKYIDFWKTDTAMTTKRSGSLIGWLDRHYPQYSSSDEYIPRAIVGEYLHDCFLQVCEQLRRHASLNVIKVRVRSVTRHDSSWMVNHGDQSEAFDRIVLTTGHEGMRATECMPSRANERFVYPTEKNLSCQTIAPGAHVLIRGFGLTAIDAILCLTEGRGGTFNDHGTYRQKTSQLTGFLADPSTETDGSGSLLPSYVNSSEEPWRIELESRSGRPMLAKPTAKVEPIRDAFWVPFRQRLTNSQTNHGQLNFYRDIWSVVLDAAAELLNQTRIQASSSDIDNWYRGWSRYSMGSAAAQQAMLRSIAVATGKRPMDIPFALGETWRRLYSELVSQLSFGGLAKDQWSSYRRCSAEMERIAFGPPAENVAKLVRLMRDGIVRIVTLNDERPVNYDCIVNAVIASPHQRANDGPLTDLIQQGWMEVDPITGAIKVDKCGWVEGKAEGLAIFGRTTEGWIIGNDTLSRTLHQQIEGWAEQMAAATHE